MPDSPATNPISTTPQASHPKPPPAPGSAHTLFVEPDDGHGPVLTVINSAKTSLALKIYLLDDPQIIQALIQAKKRGIQVRVMLEQHPFGTGPGNQAVFQTLQQAGIAVKWTNPVFRLTHEKSLVADSQQALVMTLNFTSSAFKFNREFGLITQQAAEVKEVLAGFEADWNRTSFTPAANSALVWSPANSRAKIQTFIDSAQKTLVLQQEEMQDSQVQQHLIAAAKRGVQVRVIVATNPNSTQPDNNRPGELELKAGGVQVKTLAKPYAHAKIYLTDGKQVLLGSENISTPSLDNNRELGIVVSDVAIVQRIAQTFEKDWQSGTVVQ